MSKHKKRLSVAQQQADRASPVGQADTAEPAERAASGGEVDTASASLVDDAKTAEPAESTASDQESAPSIERHPLFWFVLGALTVGIIVLLGLLLMGAGAATPSASPIAAKQVSPAATAVKPASPTPAEPDLLAIMTAVAVDHESVARINVTETKKLLDAGQALLVDVRSEYSFRDQHARGAINIPEVDTEARLSELPKNKTIILYCS